MRSVVRVSNSEVKSFVLQSGKWGFVGLCSPWVGLTGPRIYRMQDPRFYFLALKLSSTLGRLSEAGSEQLQSAYLQVRVSREGDLLFQPGGDAGGEPDGYEEQCSEDD